MRKKLPTCVEVAILAAMGFLCAAIAAHVSLQDGGLVLVVFPLLLISMLMGAWRSGKLAASHVVRQERVHPSAQEKA